MKADLGLDLDPSAGTARVGIHTGQGSEAHPCRAPMTLPRPRRDVHDVVFEDLACEPKEVDPCAK